MKKRTQGSRPIHLSRQEKLAAITKKLEEGVKEIFTSENYQAYLRTIAKFHQYSFNNTLLIALQKPDATLVASYTTWQQKFHRQVRKGEKGITIIAPVPVKAKKEEEQDIKDPPAHTGNNPAAHKEASAISMRFRAVSVFDISSTDGEPIPSIGVTELIGRAEGYDGFMKALTALSPVPIRFDEIEGGAKGYYRMGAEKEIVIQSGMSELQTVKTAVHELAHALRHDREYMKAEKISKDRHLIEQEAESIAFCVLSAFGLDNGNDIGKDYSFPYICGWAKSADITELKASIDMIRMTAGEIIEGIEKEMAKQQEVQKETIQKLGSDIKEDRPSVLAMLKQGKEELIRKDIQLPAGKETRFRDHPHRPAAGKELMR